MITLLVGNLLDGMHSLSWAPTRSFQSSCAGDKRLDDLTLVDRDESDDDSGAEAESAALSFSPECSAICCNNIRTVVCGLETVKRKYISSIVKS